MGYNSLEVNTGTAAAIYTDNTGGTGSSGSLIAVTKLDISGQGTAGTLWGGNVGVSSGTITQLPTLPGGSIVVTTGTLVGGGGSIISYGAAAAAAAAAGNPVNIGGTDSGGTIRTIKVDSGGLQRIGIDSGTISILPNLPQGSINVTSGTIATLGTMGTLGLVNTVTTLSNLSAGSIAVTSGTIASVGTIGTLGLGTITGNLGTLGTLGTVVNVGSVANLGQLYNAGTVQNILGGTVQGNPVPTIAQQTYGTHGTTGASLVGTLVGGTGSGAGTEIFITSLSLTIPSTAAAQDVSIGWGTAAGTFHSGTALIVRGNFLGGGGIQKTFIPAINSGTNAQLAYFQAGAGTVDISITYFTTTSTI